MPLNPCVDGIIYGGNMWWTRTKKTKELVEAPKKTRPWQTPAPRVRLFRLEESIEGAIGVLLVDSRVFCFTLEPDAADAVRFQIPPNRYKCVKFHGNKWKDTFEILVPGHTALLFHAGNTEHDSKGCVLLGKSVGTLVRGTKARAVLNSGDTFRGFIQHMKSTHTEEFYIEIINMYHGMAVGGR